MSVAYCRRASRAPSSDVTGIGCNSAYFNAQPTSRIGTPYTKPSDVTDAVPAELKYDEKETSVITPPAARNRLASEKPRISNGGFGFSSNASAAAAAAGVDAGVDMGVGVGVDDADVVDVSVAPASVSADGVGVGVGVSCSQRMAGSDGVRMTHGLRRRELVNSATRGERLPLKLVVLVPANEAVAETERLGTNAELHIFVSLCFTNGLSRQ